MTVNAQTLVVYYSRSGNNYTSDGIATHVPTGGDPSNEWLEEVTDELYSKL